MERKRGSVSPTPMSTSTPSSSRTQALTIQENQTNSPEAHVITENSTRLYTDEEGYTVYERNTPNSHSIMRFKQSGSDGYSYEYHSRNTVYPSYGDVFSEDYINDDFLADFWKDDFFSTQPSSHKASHSSSNSYGSCLGCLLWTIFFFILTCLVLYGMSQLGLEIFNILKGWFT